MYVYNNIHICITIYTRVKQYTRMYITIYTCVFIYTSVCMHIIVCIIIYQQAVVLDYMYSFDMYITITIFSEFVLYTV